MVKVLISVLCIMLLAGCIGTGASNKVVIEIEMTEGWDTIKPQKLKVAESSLGEPSISWPTSVPEQYMEDDSLLALFNVEKGHHPLVFRLYKKRTDQYYYVTRNQEEVDLLKHKANKGDEFILFAPEKRIRLSSDNPWIVPDSFATYITGEIVKTTNGKATKH